MIPFKKLAALTLTAVLLWNAALPAFALEAEEEPAETVSELWETEPEETEALPEPEAEEPERAEEDSVLPGNLPGMPEGYVLSDAQRQEKRELAEHRVSEQLAAMTEGVDYEAGVVILPAETEEYARMAADAYDADLISWEYGLGVLALRSLTVLEAVRLAEDPDVPLPAVNANAIVTLEPVEELPQSGAQTMGLLPEAPTWSVWIRELLRNPDEYLEDPADSMYQWHHDAIDTYAAWGVTMGDPAIRVAVIDTGADISNRDLKHVIPVDIGKGESDVYGHGTHVAGIIGAEVDNGWFGAGVAPNVTVYSIRASGSGGSFSYADIVRAINEAMALEVHLINMSLGGMLYDSTLQSAVRRAWNRGITILAAAGNDGTNMYNYPAAYDTVISVGASNKNGDRAYFSNYGNDVDVVAPGYQIPSTYLYGGAAKLNGTSMACPVATGAAALYMSKQYLTTGRIPSPEEVREALRGASVDGVLNAGKLFSGVRTAPVITVLEEDGIPVLGSTRTVSVDGTLAITQEDSNDAMILYTLDGKTPAVMDGEIVNGQIYTGPIALNTLEPGSYPVRAASLNASGVLSKVAKATLKITPGIHPEAVEITAPERMIAGKSVTLKAGILPETAAQTVEWELVDGPDSVVISKSGKLMTRAGETGTVTVRATSALDSKVFAEVSIRLENGTPASSVVLNEKTALLRVYHDEAQTFQLIPRALDGKKQLLDEETVAFSFTSSNPKVASVSADGLVTAKTPGTASITAKALDGSNKSAVCKITVKAGVESVTLTGQMGIAPGSSGKVKATTVPKSVSGSTVSWELIGQPEGVTNSKGTVKAAKSVEVGQMFGIRVTVSDGYRECSEMHWITVTPKASAVRIYQGGWYVPAAAVLNKLGCLTSAQIYSTDVLEAWETDASGRGYLYRTNLLQLEGEAVGSLVEPVWSSSNPNVATVDADGLVTGHRAGTAKITCKAQDDSGKSAVVTVKVITPASSIAIESPAARVDKVNTRFLGYGKSVTNTAALGTAYGKPTVKTVEWSVEATADGEDVTALLMDKKLLTLSKSGKLTIKSGAEALLNGEELNLTVHAKTTDGTELTDKLTYVVGNVATRIDSISGNRSLELFTNTTHSDLITMNCAYQLFTVSSSNSNVAGAYLKQDSASGHMMLVIVAGSKSGTAKITVTTADGSNRKLTYTVKVG